MHAAIRERLASASVQVANPGAPLAEDGRPERLINVSRQDVPLVGDYKLRAMPGPRYTALVHIQEGRVPNARAFLVHLSMPSHRS